MRHRAITSTIAIAMLAATAACADDGGQSGPGDSGAPNGEPDTSDPAPTVVPSGDCDALLEHYQTEALKDVGPYGLGDSGYWVMDGRFSEEEGDAASDGTESTAAMDDSAASAPGAVPGGGDVSGTNVQVEGVDEADRVKTDGELIYVLEEEHLRIVEPANDGVAERGRVKLGNTSWVDSMFLDGDTVVAVGNRWQAPVEGQQDTSLPGGAGGQYTELMEIDVSNPDEPSIERSLVIDGTPVASRLSNGVVRLVIESGPVGIEWETPEGSGLRAEMAATEANEELIRNSTIENWLPAAILDEDGELRERDIISCGDVFVPSLPSGYGTVTVMQVPVGDPLGEWNAGGVAATGAEVYATADDLYVATMDLDTWDVDDEQATGTTSIHRFETPSDGRPQYVASGQIEGRLLNQFSMDQYEDHLRVATTSGAPWGNTADSESQVVVLRQEGDALVETGRVGELGKTEQIQAVRFMEGTGYVVTFRQTDPLYVVDLSDPDNPTLQGELKIPGFSNYLHPSGDGHLLGVGQDADPESGFQQGLQVSLFDVTDPLTPERVDTYGIPTEEGDQGDSFSPVQSDHRAFTEHAEQAFIPFTNYTWNRDEQSDAEEMGFLVVPLGTTNLDDARTIVTGRQTWGRAGDNSQNIKPTIYVDRSVGIGNRLYGIGYNGIVTIDLDSYEVVDRHGWER